VFLVQLTDRDVRVVRLQLVEVAELVQAQQAHFPQPRVVNVAFLQSDLAPDYLVASSGVALELDAAYIKLFAFVDIDIEEDELLVVVEPGLGNGSKIDVTQLAVGLFQVLDSLANFFFAEDFSIFDGEDTAQRLGVGYCL